MDAVGNLKRPLQADVMRRHTCEITGLHGHFNCRVAFQQVTLLLFTVMFLLNTASRTSCGGRLKLKKKQFNLIIFNAIPKK